MYYGQFSLVIEDRSREGRQRKMDKLFQFLTDNAEEFGFDGFWETEQQWSGGISEIYNDLAQQ